MARKPTPATRYNNNDRQMASMTLQMLAGTQLTGRDVGAFVNVTNWLQGIMQSAVTEAQPANDTKQ